MIPSTEADIIVSGPQHPIHVTKTTIGKNHEAQCEVDDSQDLCQTTWRSGDDEVLSNCLKMTEFYAYGQMCDLFLKKWTKLWQEA